MKKANYIDPIIGTVGDERASFCHGGGKTYPGAVVPGGMVQVSPDTVTGGDNGTGYNYANTTIEGFSFNHMSGIGWYGDLGNLQIMPTVGETDLRSGSNTWIPFEKGAVGWRSAFSHDNETARAGYYSVLLERYGILAEATATPHTGWLRFTYPKGADARLLFNFSRRIGGHADFQKIALIDNNRIEGEIRCTPAGGGFGRGQGGIDYTLYFVCESSSPLLDSRFFADETFVEGDLTYFEHEDAGLSVRVNGDQPLVLRCGISYVDIEGARRNLEAESPDFDFDKVVETAFERWDEALSVIQVDGGDETDKTIFYSCLYHALLDPRTATDVDGRFAIGNKGILTAEHTQRTMFSGWDVYRSEFPLLTLIRPDTVNDEIRSLLTIADFNHSEVLPRWELAGNDSGCMIGNPALLVIADAYVKGIRRFDTELAYRSAKNSTKAPVFINKRSGTDCAAYTNCAFVPGTLSDTLEYLLADYAMAAFAEATGHTEDAAHHLARTKRYAENYNPAFGYMCPRDENGQFLSPKSEYDELGCCESNIFQQGWFVPYDVVGLSRLFGEKRTVELLERLFEGADLTALWNENYNHSNEPCHNLTHYFSLLGLPERTQYWTRRVQKEAYRTGPFGFCGNEDVGQLSAWYVLSALGFAQVCISKPEYVINTPLFKKATIQLDKQYHSRTVADTFTVQCDHDPLDYPYICSMTLNGQPIERPYLTYAEITAGGILKLKLSEKPLTTI